MLRDKKCWYFSLLFSSVVFLLVVAEKYVRYQIDFPLCWDPPGYVAAANLILKKGPVAWMVERRELALFYQFVAVLGAILQNTKLAQIILQTSVAVALIYAYSKLALVITNSYRIAAVTAIVTPLTPNFVSMYGAASQVSALVLLCLVTASMDYILENFKLRDRKSWILVTAGAAIFWIHSIFTFVPFFSMLFLVFFFTAKSSQRRRLLKFGTLSFIAGLIPQIAFLPSLIENIRIESRTRILVVEPTWDFYVSNLICWCGGIVVMILGIFLLLEMLRKGNKPVVLGALSWVTISLSFFHLPFLLHSFWPAWYIYAERSIWIFPVPLLLGLALSRIYSTFKNWCLVHFNHQKSVLTLGLTRKKFLSLLSAGLLILGSTITLVPSFFFIAEGTWRPWIDRDTYGQILFVRDELNSMNAQEPVFIFYRMVGMGLGGIDYLQRVIGMEIGEHYCYYGKLGYLLSGLPTPSVYFTWKPDEEQLWARRLWKRMVDHEVVDHISSHPIVIISPNFYSEIELCSTPIEQYYRGDGVYIIPPQHEIRQKFPLGILVCYTDFINATKGFYSSVKNWSIADRVLTLYVPTGANATRSEVDFPIYVQDGNLTIQAHLFDCPSHCVPIKFYIGEELVHTVHYSGTDKPIWFTFQVRSFQEGSERLRVIIEQGVPPDVDFRCHLHMD